MPERLLRKGAPPEGLDGKTLASHRDWRRAAPKPYGKQWFCRGKPLRIHPGWSCPKLPRNALILSKAGPENQAIFAETGTDNGAENGAENGSENPFMFDKSVLKMKSKMSPVGHPRVPKNGKT